MYVMPVKVLLKLTKLLPHQDMLKTGRLVRVTPEHAGKIIFVSHEWTGFSEPDPNRVQLRCLQTVLSRLKAGEEDGVQSHWQQQLVYAKGNVRIRARDWKKHLEHMFVWMDYTSMPQPTAGPMPAEADIREFVEGDDESLGVAIDEMTPSAQQASNDKTTDHRFGGDELSAALTKAVESIPSYVERSALMLILVPTTAHTGRIGDLCDLRSWRGRGWVRQRRSNSGTEHPTSVADVPSVSSVSAVPDGVHVRQLGSE